MELMITTENFEEKVLKSDVPVLVDFFAEWCGPCKMMAPVLAGIAADYEGKLVVGKCDTDDNMLLAQKYRVASIPNMQLFKDGEVIATFIGFMTKDELCEKLNKVL